MTEATLDRVHVRCRAPREQAQEALDLRARLVTTARLHLPQALEHALDDRGGRRVFVDRLDVPLDFDPRDYDDVTVAALWAGRVAQALAELDGAEPGVRVFADTRAFVAAALAGVVDHGVLDPVFAELGAGVGPVEPVRFLAAFDRASRLAPLLEALAADEPLARRLYARLRPDERRAVAAALRGETPWGDGAPGAAAAARDRDAAASGEAGGSAPDGLPAAAAPAAGGRRSDGAGASSAAGGAAAAAGGAAGLTVEAWLAAIRAAARDGAAGVRFGAAGTRGPASRQGGLAAADTAAPVPPGARREARARDGAPRRPLEEAEPTAADAEPEREPEAAEQVERLAWWSTAGGLVLLYPWLADFLRGPLPRPEPALPDPQTAARIWALAALADDEPETLLLDAAVRVLAGDDPAAERLPLAVAAESPPGFDEARDRALASFAATLPGFAGSSAVYLRRWFLRREALVEPLADGTIRVVLEPGPLDPALDLLPYPLGAFRLPWTPPLAVERRRSPA